jgi:hypothetical protein
VVRTAARFDSSRHRETRTPVLEHDACSGYQHSRPESVVKTLDQRDGQAVPVDCAEIDRSSVELADDVGYVLSTDCEMIGSE